MTTWVGLDVVRRPRDWIQNGCVTLQVGAVAVPWEGGRGRSYVRGLLGLAGIVGFVTYPHAGDRRRFSW